MKPGRVGGAPEAGYPENRSRSALGRGQLGGKGRIGLQERPGTTKSRTLCESAQLTVTYGAGRDWLAEYQAVESSGDPGPRQRDLKSRTHCE